MSLRRTRAAQRGGVLAALVMVAAGCEFEPNSVIPPRAPRVSTPPGARIALTVSPPVALPPDPLGNKPVLGAPKAFEPPAPEVIKAANGMTVWLLERRSL